MNSSKLAICMAVGVGLLAADAAAQSGVRAYSTVVRGCTAPGPDQSLLAVISDPPAVRQGARGIFVVEIEHARPAGDWRLESQHPGFTGRGYYRWAGGNYWSSPGRGVMQYRLDAESAGRFRVAIHNRHNHPDTSLENDCWIRVNGDRWWKLYSNDGRNSNVWNWHSRLDPGHGFADFDLREGENLVEISGRSTNFMIDRMHFYPLNAANAFDLSLPAQRMSERPRIGSMFAVRIGDPTGATGFAGGVGQAVLMLNHQPHGNGACGRLLPGLGVMPGTPGEFLLGEDPLPIVLPAALTFTGPHDPAVFPMPIPNQPSMIGTRARLQGLLFDGRRGVLTNRLDLHFGDR